MFSFRLLRFVFTIVIFGNAFSSIAATPTTVKLYWPEDLDEKGKQVPNSPRTLEIFSYFEREAGLKFDLTVLPWKRAQLEVLQGKGLLYGFSKTSERLTLYRFSQPVTTLHLWTISYGAANANLAEIKDLKGKTLVTGLGLAHGLEYENARNHVFTVQEDYASSRDHFKRLVSKRVDVMLLPSISKSSREQMATFVNNTLIPGFKDPELNGKHFEISVKPMFYDTIHFASGKGHYDELIDRLDKAILRGMKNGTLAKLYQ